MAKTTLFTFFLFLSAFSIGQTFHRNYHGSRFSMSPDKKAYYKPAYNDLMERYDVTFYKLDLSADNTSAYLDGSVIINATVEDIDLDTFVVELFYDYTVDSILINDIRHDHLINGDEIFVPVSPSLSAGTLFNAQIFYHGELSQEIQDYGIGIVNDDEYSVTYTLSDPFFSKFWFPCKQVLSDKADSVHIFITTDSTLKAGSNGLLTATIPLGGGKVRYEWKSKYPIAYYLISICISDYVEYSFYAKPEGLKDSILVQNYVYDSAYLESNKEYLDATGNIIEAFSSIFGIYPFKDEKYGHCLAPMNGGMEHQTMTTLSGVDFGLVAHELAHQWFGDYVTCGTWQDIWINEGFATYSELLAVEQLSGEFPADYYNAYYDIAIQNAETGSVFIPEEEFNIDYSNGNQIYDLTMRIFNYPLSYAKGAMVLHMIRFILKDDEMYFLTLRNYLNSYSEGFATGLDFKNVLENTTGKDFTDFFNQWYFGEGYPIYNILWYQESDTLIINSIQTTTSADTTLFTMPMEYKILHSGGDTVLSLIQEENDQVFRIHLPETVNNIIVNRNNNVLASIESVNFFTGMNDKYLQPSALITLNTVFNDYLELDFGSIKGQKNVILRDITGRVIFHKMSNDQSLSINTNSLPKGIYIIEIFTGNNRTVTKIIR